MEYVCDENNLIREINKKYHTVKRYAESDDIGQSFFSCEQYIRLALTKAIELFWVKKHNKSEWEHYDREGFYFHGAVNSEKFKRYFDENTHNEICALYKATNASGGLLDNSIYWLESLERCIKAIERAIPMTILLPPSEEFFESESKSESKSDPPEAQAEVAADDGDIDEDEETISAQLKKKKPKTDDLYLSKESREILRLIFGDADVSIDLDSALAKTTAMLYEEKPAVVSTIKPLFKMPRRKFRSSFSDYAQAQILLGTIYAYKHEFIKAAYHFMNGLKTDECTLNPSYCDFIQYVISKAVKDAPTDESRSGRGFSPDMPMGSCEGHILIARYAKEIIPEMHGINGEIILATNTKLTTKDIRMVGCLSRIGSCWGDRRHPIDIYETYIIDDTYRLQKIYFYFDGYFTRQPYVLARVAEGFEIDKDSHLNGWIIFLCG